MKDLLIIDSKFALEFWAKIINKVNYLYNYLSIKIQIGKIIPKKV